MGKKDAGILSKEQLAAIEKILVSGNRVELIPCKEGVRIIKILRHNIMALATPSQK